MLTTTKNFCQICGFPTLEGVCIDENCKGSIVLVSHQVLISYQKARLPRRVSAVVIDFAPLVVLEAIGLVLSPFTLGVSGMVTSAFGLVYVCIKDFGAGAYSPGKRLHNLTVIDRNGNCATNAQAVVRNLPYILAWLIMVLPDPLGLLGVALAFFLVLLDSFLVVVDDQGKRLGDRLASTKVIEE